MGTKLVFLQGELAGREFEFPDGVVRLGREADNSVILLSDGVSRYHAEIHCEHGAMKLLDLGSTNGVALNGPKISGTEVLSHGDVVEIAQQKFQVFNTDLMAAPVTLAALDEPTSEAPQAKVEKPSTAKRSSKKKRQELAATMVIPDELFCRNPEVEEEDSDDEVTTPKRRISNLTFAVLVIALAVILLSVFIIWEKNSAEALANGASEQVRSPFILVYEREKHSADNVFRFQTRIEDENVAFVLDDLKSQRHFERSFSVANNESFGRLKSTVRDSGFLGVNDETTKSKASGDFQERRRLMVINNFQQREQVIYDDYAPRSFEDLERGIEQLAESFSLAVMSQTPEELLERARKSLAAGNNYLDNYQGTAGNLPLAIHSFTLAKDLLESFQPKPPEWEVARRKLQEATALRDRLVGNLKSECERLSRLKQYSELRTALRDLMAYLDLDSPDYEYSRRMLYEVEMRLNKGQERRR